MYTKTLKKSFVARVCLTFRSKRVVNGVKQWLTWCKVVMSSITKTMERSHPALLSQISAVISDFSQCEHPHGHSSHVTRLCEKNDDQEWLSSLHAKLNHWRWTLSRVGQGLRSMEKIHAKEVEMAVDYGWTAGWSHVTNISIIISFCCNDILHSPCWRQRLRLLEFQCNSHALFM